MHFCCTQHAQERWIERCAAYGDETGQDVIAAVSKAVHVRDVSSLPFAVTENTHYYCLADTQEASRDVYFVVEPLDRETGRVVSVIVPGMRLNYLNPKKKARRAPEASLEAAALVAESEEELILPEPPPGLDVVQLWQWWREQHFNTASQLRGLTRTDSRRPALLQQQCRLAGKTAELEVFATEVRRRRAAADASAIEVVPPAFADVVEERYWYVAELRRVCDHLSLLAASKGLAMERVRWNSYREKLQAKTMELKAAAFQLVRERHAEKEAAAPLYDEAGRLNWTTAFTVLTKRINELEQRLALLEHSQ